MWVFAYGSLIWDPGFAPLERVAASLRDWRRSFCMSSIHYRGTPQAPGLVLALDAEAGALCQGLALRVAPAEATEVLQMLRARELVSSAYIERQVPLALEDGRQVTALAYVIDPGHAQYCRHDPAAQARIIAGAAGLRGPNRDYLFNTVAHLAELGIPDPELEALARQVRDLPG